VGQPEQFATAAGQKGRVLVTGGMIVRPDHRLLSHPAGATLGAALEPGTAP